ncbi:MAG: CotH kinase family protein [Bacteroidales bacterium]|nr:CotH kinase family protein [Bacteroidales bacterium]
MKLYKILVLFAVALCAFSCTEKDNPVDPPQTPEPKEVKLTLKHEVQAGSPSWTIACKVRLFDEFGNAATLTRDSEGLYPVPEPLGKYIVLSPETESSFDGSFLTLTYPSSVEASSAGVPGTLAFAAAAGKQKTLTLESLFSGLILSFLRDDVKSVTIRAAAGESLSGAVRYSLNGWEAEALSDGGTLQVQAPSGYLKAGQKWVVVLPPQTLSGGLVISVETLAGDYEYALPESRTLERGRFVSVEVPDGIGLKKLYVNTPGGVGIYSKDSWVEGCSFKLVDMSGKVRYESAGVSVKGRGNSTWNYPKKPYAVKLPEKADLLGTGADKRWVLLANWMDRTLLRNDVAFEVARRCAGLEWTPSGEFVELYLNGRHMGNYWLGEKVKTGKARLQADFLIEMDTYYDAVWRFYSSYGRRVNEWAAGMPVGIKEPDDDKMTDELFNEVKTLVGGVEESLYLNQGKWQELLDIDSFADWYLVHELCCNFEPNHPKSCYFYFRDGVMYAGPVWDFDWYTFQPGIQELNINRSIYFEKLLSKPEFVTALKSRWAAIKPLIADIPDYIDAKAASIGESEAINWRMWPCTSSGVNGDERLSFSQAVTRMKEAFTYRVNALDSEIQGL